MPVENIPATQNTSSFITETDLEAVRARKAVDWVIRHHHLAIERISKATMDQLSTVLCAHAHVTHAASGAHTRYNDCQRQWSRLEADTIKKSHEGWSHWLNMGGGLIAAGVGTVCTYRQLFNGLNEAQMQAMRSYQKTGQALGQMGQFVGSWFHGGEEGDRTIAQSHQGILGTDRQETSQSKQTTHQAAQDTIRKASESEQARHQAFESFLR